MSIRIIGIDLTLGQIIITKMKRCWLIFLILALNLILNLYGIKWGLPSKDFLHPSFHPDETASLESAQSILNPNQILCPNPEAFGNGAMQFYLVALFYQLGRIFGLLNPKPDNYADFTYYYLVGRLVTVVMSSLTVYFLFLVTEITFGINVALFASLFLTTMPGFVISSHYFRSEVPAAFWLVLTLFFIIKMVQTGQTKFYLLAAMSGGFATSTKYNSIFAVFLIIIAHSFSLPKNKRNLKSYLFDKKLMYSYLITIVSFLVGSIGILLHFDLFWERLLKQLVYQKSPFLESIGLGPSWLGYFTQILPYSMTLPLLTLGSAGLVWAFIKRNKWDIILITWLLAYYFLMTRTNWWVVRYTIPLLPPLAILASRSLFDFLKKGWTESLRQIIAILLVAIPLIYSLILDSILAAKDPRITTHQWIRKNIPYGKSIGVEITPASFYVPADVASYQVISMQLDEKKLSLIDYYIANDQIYQHYLRVPHLFPVESRYFNTIFDSGQFKKVAEFENPMKLFGWKFPKGYPPHDFMYFFLKISIYQRMAKIP